MAMIKKMPSTFLDVIKYSIYDLFYVCTGPAEVIGNNFKQKKVDLPMQRVPVFSNGALICVGIDI